MNGIKTIKGLETEISEEMEPTVRTVQILSMLEKKGAVTFQCDDGEEDYKTLQQLTEIAGDVGYDLIGYRNREAIKLTDKNEIPGSGCYILFFADAISIDLQ